MRVSIAVGVVIDRRVSRDDRWVNNHDAVIEPKDYGNVETRSREDGREWREWKMQISVEFVSCICMMDGENARSTGWFHRS